MYIQDKPVEPLLRWSSPDCNQDQDAEGHEREQGNTP